MAETFSNGDELQEFVRFMRTQSEQQRLRLSDRIAIDQCYYEGVQWMSTGQNATFPRTALGRLMTNWDPDRGTLRVTRNRIFKHVTRAAITSHPANLDVEVVPSTNGPDVRQALECQYLENLLEVAQKMARYLAARRDANWRRHICGRWGIGLTRELKRANLNNMQLADSEIQAFTFNPLRLSLDPGVQSRDLRQHDHVVFSTPMTARRIERLFGRKYNEDNLMTIGQLQGYELSLGMLTNGTLFGDVLQNSNTKGAMVHYVHCRDGRRWDRMYVLIENIDEQKSWDWVNQDNPYSPFGGDGLPYALMPGFRRSESMWDVGSVAAVKDDQDYLNLVASIVVRSLRNQTGGQWVVDQKWFGGRIGADEDLSERIHNAPGGIIVGAPNSSDRTVTPPQVVQYPPPAPILTEMEERAEQKIMEGAFRGPGNYGLTKSHVPDASFQTSLDQSDAVLGVLVQEDLEMVDRPLLEVLLGTVVDAAKNGSPTVLGEMGRANLASTEDMLVLAGVDPNRLPGMVRVRESSVRYRSHNQRRRELGEAAQLQAVTPSELRKALADDLDSPAMDADRRWTVVIARSVRDIVNGQEWPGASMGIPYGSWMVDALREAQFDPEVRKDPAAVQRLAQAIVVQQQMNAVDAGGGMVQEEEGAAQQQPQDLGQLIQMLDAGGVPARG